MITLFNIIVIIVAVWVLLKIKSFISSIKITASKSAGYQKDNAMKNKMDIQDAEYEEME